MSGARSACAGLLVPALLGLASCGDDVSAPDACERVVESYAKGWERCGRSTYQEAYDLFSNAFVCSQQKNVSQSQLDECVADVTALDCGAVGNGHQPASCNVVVSD